ncbi:MAG TPA: sigma-70 family RNA polymerase sigma factor [Longimicrobiales bacterium]|nr:sigma-70 family RNA polymerase sigma factor [Longimicrobiales bacterium]
MTDHTTILLQAARAGDRSAFDELFSLAYDELRRAAHQRLSRSSAGETLNTTVLVHEAYVRLVDGARAEWADRAHFLALASRAMRFVLIDHVRSASAEKRGGGMVGISLDDVELSATSATQDHDLLALNEALEKLSSYSPRLALVVEYRFFGGLTHEEIAAAMNVSVPTVKRDWVRARAWLFDAMQSERTPT